MFFLCLSASFSKEVIDHFTSSWSSWSFFPLASGRVSQQLDKTMNMITNVLRYFMVCNAPPHRYMVDLVVETQRKRGQYMLMVTFDLPGRRRMKVKEAITDHWSDNWTGSLRVSPLSPHTYKHRNRLCIYCLHIHTLAGESLCWIPAACSAPRRG